MTKPKTAKPGAPPAHRPTKFTPEMVKDVLLLASKGCVDEEIAQILKISVSTLNNWKKSKAFLESIHAAKSEVNALVRQALLTRALGYEYTEDFATKDGAVACQRVAHPDVNACRFWLLNRESKQWRNGAGDPEDEGKAVKNLFQLFLSVREKEAGMIRAGNDQLDVLFGADAVKSHKSKKTNATTDNPTKRR